MRYIPNILSYFRILLIPFFIWEMLQNNGWAAALVLAVSGLTDMLDGFLARRYNWISEWGKVLDPLADKLTQVAVCIVMFAKMREYWFFFAVLLLKEILMLIIGAYLVKHKIKIEGAKWFGKILTILFYFTMVLIVFITGMPSWAVITLLSLTTFFALIATMLYIPEFKKYNREIKDYK
ncbi:MAG: CDP-alcohol phosphatidyltransferase family protein [Syntrophomonadaceae bacterium]|nr:CDP-alcohol phosphatidyltransferase family protein [Syntrophomonadaceae bacterium]